MPWPADEEKDGESGSIDKRYDRVTALISKAVKCSAEKEDDGGGSWGIRGSIPLPTTRTWATRAALCGRRLWPHCCFFLFFTSSWSPRFSRSFHFEKDHVSRLGKTEMSCQVQILSTECQARHVRG